MGNKPSLTPKEVIKLIEQNGFIFQRAKGSHQVFYNSHTQKRIIVPMHNKDLSKGLLIAILKQAGIKY